MLSAFLQLFDRQYLEWDPLLAHTNQPIIGSYHEQAIVGATAKQAENGSAKIPLVTS